MSKNLSKIIRAYETEIKALKAKIARLEARITELLMRPTPLPSRKINAISNNDGRRGVR